jgi:hypothetical protein
MDGSVVLGVVGGDADHPRLGYVKGTPPVTPALLELAEPVAPTEVFRFAAPCAEGGCQHFDGARCGLVRQIVTLLPPVIDRLPPCSLRPDCRWWREQGRQACRRCPAVVTETHRPSAELAAATRPPASDDGACPDRG